MLSARRDAGPSPFRQIYADPDRRSHRAIDDHVYDRVRHFVTRRHKTGGRGTAVFPMKYVFGELGVRRLRYRRPVPPPWASS